MAAPKAEEISHPPMDQLQGLEYCIDSNPSWGMLTLVSSFLICIFSFIQRSNFFVCAMRVMCLFSTVNSGDNSFGFPALHFGLRNCSHDSFISCAFDGWN